MNNYVPPLPWQKNHWQQLYRSHQDGRLPHALLLVGQTGLGKHLFAEHFAKTLLCQQPQHAVACQNCRDCNWVAANTHPDLCTIVPEKTSKGIKIDQIREVIEKLQQTSVAAYKILIINPADSLLVAASNALLKSLEEPTDRCLFILLSENSERLLPTIRSRCHVIRFTTPEKSVACDWLAQQLPESSAIEQLHHLAAGSPLQVLAYAKRDYYKFYTDLLMALTHLVNKEIDPIQCAATYLKSDSDQLLNTLLHLVSELIKCQLLRGYTATERGLAHLAKSLSTGFLFDYFDLLIEFQRHTAKTTLNVQLMSENLFSRWALQGKSC